jgi:hypothetical protein
MVADHKHVKVFVERVTGVGSGGIGGRRKDVIVLYDRDDVWCVAASSTFGVVGVDRAVLESCDSGLDEPTFVQGIGVDQYLNIVLVRYSKAVVNCGRRRAPVFVELETTDTGLDLFAERSRLRVVTFACDALV